MAGVNIVVPLLYNSGDCDVGTLSLVSGRTFNLTDVKLSDVRGVVNPSIGQSSFQSLATHSNVNQWAAFRPWNRPTYEAIHSNYTYGYDLSSGNSGGLQRALNTSLYGYSLGSFGGYNHNAQSSTLTTTSITKVDKNDKDFSISFRWREICPRDFHNINTMYVLQGQNWDFDNVLLMTSIAGQTSQATVSYNANFPSSHIVSWDNPVNMSVWFGNNSLSNIASNRYKWHPQILGSNIPSGEVNGHFSVVWEKYYTLNYEQEGDWTDRHLNVDFNNQEWGGLGSLTTIIDWQVLNNLSLPGDETGISMEIYWSESPDGSNPQNSQTFNNTNSGTYNFNVNTLNIPKGSNIWVFFDRTAPP